MIKPQIGDMLAPENSDSGEQMSGQGKQMSPLGENVYLEEVDSHLVFFSDNSTGKDEFDENGNDFGVRAPELETLESLDQQ